MTFLASLLLLVLGFPASVDAQSLTTVSDTLYNADGTKPSGTMVISWLAFTASDDTAVGQGSKEYTITDGVISVTLVPNESSTPTGTCYEVSMRLTGTGRKTEMWSVPAASPATLADVRDPTLASPCASIK